MRNRQFSFLTASSLAIACATPVAAQGASNDQPSPAPEMQSSRPSVELLSDIVVTARRVEERLQDVPISITVYDQDQLSNRNVTNSQDLAIYTPSLSAYSNFGTENSTFAIRGFVQDIGTPPSVGVYFADVVAPRGAAQGTPSGDGAGPGSFFDLQNVQILKGPQGTLFGRNTTGGAILLVPQQPTDVFEGYVEGSFGNYDMRRLQAALNVPISDTVRLRIAADDHSREGYLRNKSGIGPKDYNDINYTAVRASLVIDVTPDIENYTIFSYSHSNTNGSTHKAIACAPNLGFGAVLACPQIEDQKQSGGFFDLKTNMTDPISKLEQWQVINTTTWVASEQLTIKNIASYAEFRNVQRGPMFGTNWSMGIPMLGIPNQQIAFNFLRPIPGGKTAAQSTFTEELQFQGASADRKLIYQFGGYVEISKPLETVGVQTPVMIGCTDPDNFQCIDVLGIGASAQTGFQFPVNIGSINQTTGRTHFRNVGLYSQATYNFSDQLSATGGFRYTWDKHTNTSRRLTYLFPVLPPFTGDAFGICTDMTSAPSCSERLEQKSSKPTWLISLDYKPNYDTLVYLKYTRGYRTGGVFANSPIEYRVFEPEQIDSYEAGFKASFSDTIQGILNVSAFYNDFRNQQLQASFEPAPGAPVAPTTGVVNAGKSRIWGFEVETSIMPFPGLRLDGSYAYLNARIKRIDPIVVTDPNYIASNQIEVGNSLFLSPENKFSITATYTLPVEESVGTITLGATYTYTDKQRSTYLYNNPAFVAAYGANLGIVDDFDLLNLNINWSSIAGSPVDLSLFAVNVLKEKYFAFVPGVGALGVETAVLGEPRTYGLRLRYRFGG